MCYMRKKGSTSLEFQVELSEQIKELLPTEYEVSREVVDIVSFEIEEAMEQLLKMNLTDESQTFDMRDSLITYKYNLIRNDILKQQIHHMDQIQEIEEILQNEVQRRRKHLKLAIRELQICQMELENLKKQGGTTL